MQVPDVIARAPNHRRGGAPIVAPVSRRHDGANARLSRQHTPQLNIVVLRRQADIVSAIGEQTDSAIEMAHVRQSVNNKENPHGDLLVGSRQ
jgi:hypothetical protein